MSFHSYLHFTPFKTGLHEGSSRAAQTSVSGCFFQFRWVDET